METHHYQLRLNCIGRISCLCKMGVCECVFVYENVPTGSEGSLHL